MKTDKTRKKYVKKAEHRAVENGFEGRLTNGIHYIPDFKLKEIRKKSKIKGILPRRKFLIENGDQTLYQYSVQSTTRHFFQHIPRDGYTKLSEWLRVAKDLAKRNGGVLPSYTWLKEHKYFGLIWALGAHPEDFGDLEQETYHRSLDQWVELAEELESKHGYLPSCTWLLDNGYRAPYMYYVIFSILEASALKKMMPGARLQCAHELSNTSKHF